MVCLITCELFGSGIVDKNKIGASFFNLHRKFAATSKEQITYTSPGVHWCSAGVSNSVNAVAITLYSILLMK